MVWSAPTRRSPMYRSVNIHKKNVHKPTPNYFNVNSISYHINICFVKENNVYLYMWLSNVQTTIKHMISNNPDLLLILRWISLDFFRRIIHNQVLSSLWSTLPTTWTLDMSIFKAVGFGDAVDSHQFGLFILDNINTTWDQYLETRYWIHNKTLRIWQNTQSNIT